MQYTWDQFGGKVREIVYRGKFKLAATFYFSLYRSSNDPETRLCLAELLSAVISCFSLISCPFLAFENFRIHFNIDQVNFRPALNYRQSDDQCIKAISAFFTSLNHYYTKKLNDRVTLENQPSFLSEELNLDFWSA